MFSGLRRSFALKLIAGGCAVALVVIGGVASYLIISRAQQTRAAAESNADNRVGVMAQVLDRFTGGQSVGAASSLAAQPALAEALGSADPAAAVSSLFAKSPSVDLAGEELLITDVGGRILYSKASSDMAGNIGSSPRAVTTALNGGQCQRSGAAAVAGGCGVELLSDGTAAYAVALPVVGTALRALGAVAYVAPLGRQLDRFQSLFGFPTAFVPATRTDLELRPTQGGSTPTDPALRAVLGQSGTTFRATYNAPLSGGGVGEVAASFLPVADSDKQLTGFIGIEVPLAQFVGDERSDIVVVVLISVFVLLLVVLAVVVFVDRFVKRPIARLEVGVERIAGGDYTTGIEIRSADELGRLAGGVNRMRDAISEYVDQLKEARQRLDHAVERVSDVSRALTTTTAGVGALQQAVVRTAVQVAGAPAAAMLAVRRGERLRVVATDGEVAPLSEWKGLKAVIRGETVRVGHARRGTLSAVPMYYQDDVVGALGVIVRSGAEADAVDVGVLAVLANNAAIAMENARLYQQERETVHRLRELDSMKSDFLSTVQHELRTPLTAILGLADLLEMCWETWADEAKMDALRDIQVAAKNLYDIVETIIDFSAMEDDNLRLSRREVAVRSAVEETLSAVAERYKEGLPVPVDVQGDPELTAHADAERFTQVLRALIDNAVKFSDGRGRVRVGLSDVDHGQSTRLEIADQGIGIAEADLSRIFDRFYQVDNTATRKYGGTGMGLALVKRMVRAHGARVEVQSTPGQGTTVVLVWPATEAAAGREAPASVEETRDEARERSPGGAVPVQ